jgi:hypothetical protein
MRLFILLLDQWNKSCIKARKLQDWWKLDIGVLEEDYSSEWSSPSFEIPKKNGERRIQIIVET